MARLRDDPGFRQNVCWYARGVNWPLLAVILAVIGFMIWRVAASW